MARFFLQASDENKDNEAMIQDSMQNITITLEANEPRYLLWLLASRTCAIASNSAPVLFWWV